MKRSESMPNAQLLTFGDALQEIERRWGIPTSEIAQVAGFHRKTFFKWKKDDRSIPRAFAADLREAAREAASTGDMSSLRWFKTKVPTQIAPPVRRDGQRRTFTIESISQMNARVRTDV